MLLMVMVMVMIMVMAMGGALGNQLREPNITFPLPWGNLTSPSSSHSQSPGMGNGVKISFELPRDYF